MFPEDRSGPREDLVFLETVSMYRCVDDLMATALRRRPASEHVAGASRFVLIGGLTLFLAVSPQGGAVEDNGSEVRGYYLAGGSFLGGVHTSCGDDLPLVPEEWKVDGGAACSLRCPGNTCEIQVWDDYHGNDVFFRICFEGEDFCRPGLYHGSATAAGQRVTVVPHLETATHGVVIVR